MIGLPKLTALRLLVCVFAALLAGCGSGEKSANFDSAPKSIEAEKQSQADREPSEQLRPFEQANESGGNFQAQPNDAADDPSIGESEASVQSAEDANEFSPIEPPRQPSIADRSEPQLAPHQPIDSAPRRIKSAPKQFRSARPLPKMAAPNDAAAEPPPIEIEEEPAAMAAPDSMPSHLDQLPAGAVRSKQEGFATVQVFYATDRNRMGASDMNKNLLLAGVAVILLPISLGLFFWRKPKLGIVAGLAACGIMVLAQVQNQLISVKQHEIAYSGQRGELVRGVCSVSVPDTHQRGVVERPSLLRFEFKENEKKHVILQSIAELDPDDYYHQLQSTVAQSPDSDLLVFIHGFNVDFESAVRRTAQIAVDLPFRGVPICYSWPSQGSLLEYTVDENNAAWTVYNLRQFLVEIAERSGARSINVVAHSMGNRAMTAALSQIAREANPQQLPIFDQIVLAAPDVDADLFRRELAPRLAEVGRNVTLYASSDDQALVASKKIHGGYPRAGESGEDLVVSPFVETIDVSGIDLSLLGHSYYGNSEYILRDLFDLVRNRLSASQRSTLVAQQKSNIPYWVLRQSRLSHQPSNDRR